ncbi:MAG: hypothetical protein MUD07_03500 [Burkholderiaceae bacterium]|nr:hypothetical protein [Burkholderiaceae bacterium]
MATDFGGAAGLAGAGRTADTFLTAFALPAAFTGVAFRATAFFDALLPVAAFFTAVLTAFLAGAFFAAAMSFLPRCVSMSEAAVSVRGTPAGP